MQVPTWHQLQPGEKWTGCRGCHAHTNGFAADEFTTSLAGQEGFVPTDLSHNKPQKFYFERDVQPILVAHGLPSDKTVRDSVNVVKWRSRVSSLIQQLTDAGATAEEIRAVAIWIDTGAGLDNGGGKYELDSLKPALWVGTEQPVKVGACDVDGEVTLVATVDGEPVTLAALGDHTWQLEPIDHDALVSVTATDEAGNATTIERHVIKPVPPPPTEEEIAAVHQQVAQLQATIDGLTQQITGAEQAIAAAEQQIAMLNQQADTSNQQIATLTAQIVEAQQQIADLVQQITTLNQQIADGQQQIVEGQQQITGLQESIPTLQQQIATLQQQIIDLLHSIGE